MKNILIALGFVFVFQSCVFADDITITITVPQGQRQQALAWFIKADPIPDANNDGTPDHTAAQWVALEIKRFLRDQVITGREMEIEETAHNAQGDLPEDYVQ